MEKILNHCSEENHQHCIDHALAQAEQLCKQQGLRFTQLRQRLLELVWQSHQPMGAYDILEVLSS